MKIAVITLNIIIIFTLVDVADNVDTFGSLECENAEFYDKNPWCCLEEYGQLCHTTPLPPRSTFSPPTIEVRSDMPGDEGCDIKTPNSLAAPVYIQMLNEYESVFMPKGDLSFKLRNNVKMIAICPGEFADDQDTIKTVICLDGDLVYAEDEALFDATLECKTGDRSELFEKKGDTDCPQTNYAIGLNVSGQMITFAESCFDKDKVQLYYVHYKASKPSQFLSNYIPEIFLIDNAYDDVRKWDLIDSRYRSQKKIKDEYEKNRDRRSIPVNMNMTDNNKSKKKRSISPVTNQFIYKSIQQAILQVYDKGEIPNIEIHEDAVLNLIKDLLSDASQFLHYHLVNIFPEDTFEPFVKNPFENRTILQEVFGWENLVYGNWRYFHKLLKLRALEETFEVYLGVSDYIALPASSDCAGPLDEHSQDPIFRHHLDIEISKDVSLKIPKYFWAYIKSADPLKSFVAIGANSPYYEYFAETMLVCNDMCDTVLWLADLEKFRKYDPFGIIVCCPVEDVKYILDGFPKNP